jgi:heme exporter protein B
VCALLASLLSVQQLYGGDFADGSLDQMLVGGTSAWTIAVAKAASHWLVTGVPLVAATPLFGLLFGLDAAAIATLALSLLLGTPILALLGGLGAALTLGLRSAGMLLILVVLPLTVPALILGAGSVVAVESALSPRAHLSLLGALLIFSALLAPPATAAALRIATE